MSFNFSHGLGRIKYAKGVYYREELFEKAMDQARNELKKAEEAGLSAGNADYDSFVQAIEEAIKGKKDYQFNKRVDDDKSFIERKIKYAKQQGSRFMDRVEKSHQEVREKIEALLADPEIMEFGGGELKTFLEEKEKEMVTFEKDLKFEEVKKKLEDDKSFVERRIKYAKDQGLRFMDRVEKTHEEVNKRLDEMSDNEGYREYDSSVQDFIDEKREDMDNYLKNLRGEEIKKELDREFDSITRKLKDARGQVPRFLDRAEKAVKEIEEKLDEIFLNEKYFGIDSVEDFLAENRHAVREFGKEVHHLILADQIGKGVWDAEHKLSGAFRELERYGLYQDRAHSEFIQAQDNAQELEDSHPEWTDAPRWYEFRDSFDTKCAEFQELYDKVALKEESKKAMENVKSVFSFASTYRKGSFARALDYLTEAREAADMLRDNDRLSRLDEVDDFLNDFDDKWLEMKDSFDEEILVEDLKKAIDKALTPLSHAGSYFKSGHEGRALDYYEEAKDAKDELFFETRFLSRPELQEFTEKFDKAEQEFKQLYEETVLKDLKKKVTEKATTNLSHANTYFNSHHIQQSLSYLEEAKEATREATQEEKLKGVDGMDEFFEKMETGIAEFEEKILAHYLNEEKKSALSTAKSHTDWALSYFESHRNAQALEYRDQALGDFEDIEANEKLANLDDVKEALVEMRKKIQEFDDLYKERVTKNLFKDLTSTALQHVSNAESHLKAAAYDRCLEGLSEGKEKAAEVMGDASLISAMRAEVDEFEEKFNSRVREVEEKYNQEMIANLFKSKRDAVSMPFSFADSDFKAGRNDSALEKFQQAKSARDDMMDDLQLAKERKEEVQAFIDDFDKKAAEWKQNFAAQVLHKEVKDALDKANTLLSHANTYFDGHRDGQALDYYDQATAAAGEVAIDERFVGLPQVVEFQEKFNQGAKEFKERFAQRRKGERIKEMRDKATRNISNAESYFNSHRRSQALSYLRDARDAVEEYKSDTELMAETDSAQWLSDVNERISTFEKTYTETVFAEQLKKAKEACDQPLSNAKQALEKKEAKKATSALEKARDAAAELGADERFLRSEGVDEYLSNFGKEVTELRSKVQLLMDAEERKVKQDKANTLLSHSETYFNGHHRAQGLNYLAQARDALEDLDPSDGEMKTFIDDFQARLNKVSETFEKVMFAEEITALQRNAEGYLKDAKFNLQTNQKERALELLRQAKEAAAKLGEERFFGCEEVTAFFEGWTKKVAEFEEDLQRALFTEQVKKAIDRAEGHLRIANTFAKQKVYPRAVEAMQEAKAALDDLVNNPDFGETKMVVKFAGKFEASLKTLGDEINAEMFRDEVEQRCRQATHHMSTAESLYKNHSIAQSLEQYQTAKRLVEELSTSENYSNHELAKKTCSELTSRLEGFASTYAQSELTQKGRELLYKLTSGLEEVNRLERRGFGDSRQARDALSNLDSIISGAHGGENKGLLLECDGVKEAVEKVKAKQVEYAEKAFGGALNKRIAQGDKVIETVVKKHLERGLVDMAVSSFNTQVRAPFSSLLEKKEDATYIKLLPAFSPYVAKMEEFAKVSLRGKTRFLTNQGSEGGKSGEKGVSSGNAQTILDMFPGWKIEPEEPLKYATVPMTVDINPNLYNYVKELNTLAGRLNTESRKAIREVQKMPFDKSASLKSLGGDGYALDITYRCNSGYPIESVTECLNKVRKQVEGAVKERPEDPTTLKLKENAEQYEKGWKELYGKWDTLMKTGKEVKKVFQDIAQIQGWIAGGKECYGVNSNPNTIGFGKITDYEVFLKAIAQVESTRKKIERIAGKHDGIFPKREKIEQELDAMYKEARTIHPLHCMRVYMFMAGNKFSCRDAYVRALRRFPLARAALKQRMLERKMHFYTRREHELADCKHSQWTVNDPFEDTVVKDRFKDETVEEYELPYHVIVPGSGVKTTREKAWELNNEAGDNLPFAGRSDQSTNRVYNDIRKKYEGQIVFSKKSIDALVESSSDFSSEFDGNDEIFGRAFWPRSLYNYALGIDKKTDKPLYGPESKFGETHYGEFMMEVLIDGKKVARPGQPGEMFASFRFKGGSGGRQGSQIDFWTFNQTCRLHLGLNAVDATDDWHNCANRLRRAYKSLSAGKHEVEVNLRFRVCTTDDNLERKKPGNEIFPLHNTPISAPIATGKFTVNIADPAAIKLGQIYASNGDQCTLSRPMIAKNEQFIQRWLESAYGWGKRASKTEEPTRAVVQGTWYVCSTSYFEVTISSHEVKLRKEPTQYAIPCKAYFYRSPETGWEKETMVEFDLSALAPETRNPKIGPPVVGVAVGGNGQFDVDLLPDEEIAKLRKRCKEEWRQGTLFKDEEQQKYFKQVEEAVKKAIEQCSE